MSGDPIRDYHLRSRAAEDYPAPRTAVEDVPRPELEDLVPKGATDGLTEVRIARHDPRLPAHRIRMQRLDEAGEGHALALALQHRAGQVQRGSIQAAEAWAWTPTSDDLLIARARVACIAIDGIEIDSTEPLWAFRQRFYPPPGRVAFGREDEWGRVVSAFMRVQDS